MAAKGPDGRSSVYRDAAGRWHGWVSFGTDGSTGKRRRRHVQGPTKTVVAAKVAELERQRAAGAGLAPGRVPTVAEWARTWLEAQASQVRPATLDGYRPDVARLLAALGTRRVDKVTPADIEALYVATRREVAAATVAHLHRTVSACFVAAERAGVIGAAPTRRVRGPSAPPPEVVPLSAGEARAVLKVARGRRNAARWSVALALGLRQGEALGLCWDDMDLGAGRLTVRHQLQWRPWSHGCRGTCGHRPGYLCPLRVGGGPELVEPKSRAGRRSVGLPAALVAELAAHREAQAGEASQPGWDLVFRAPDGGPIRPEPDLAEWHRLLVAAGVASRRLHDARHTAATLLLVQGVSPTVAMTVLGHSDLGTTRRYQHVVDELRRDAAERMGEALWGVAAAS